MRPGAYGRTQGMQQLAAAVVGASAAAQHVGDGRASWVEIRRSAVVDAAREFYRTGGQNHDEFMAAVQDLELALDDRDHPSCYCGTGREHRPGEGYHCRRAQDNADG